MDRFNTSREWLKSHRPNWFIRQDTLKSKQRLERTIAILRSGNRLTKLDEKWLRCLFSRGDKGRKLAATYRHLIPTFMVKWVYEDREKEIFSLLNSGAKRPTRKTAIGRFLSAKLCKDKDFRRRVKEINPRWVHTSKEESKKELFGKFGEWEVIRKAGRIHGYIGYLCKCSCGKERVVTAPSLRKGKSKSCGHSSRYQIGHPPLINKTQNKSL